MIEKLHIHTIKQRIYQNPGESPMYAVVGIEPPNLQELMDKINEIIDYLNDSGKEEDNE